MENWIIIQKGVMPPNDFIIDGEINRVKYVVECGCLEQDKWRSEYDSHGITTSHVGENVLGTNNYQDIRFRERTSKDSEFDVKETSSNRIISNLLSSHINEPS